MLEDTNGALSPESIFVHDTCDPPCWFGLTSGVSTRQDVIALLETNPSFGLFYSEALIDSSWVEFGWLFPLWESSKKEYPVLPNRIQIDNDIVVMIEATVPTDIDLSTILDLYGQPEFVEEYHEFFVSITLFYPKTHMSVSFTTSEECNIKSIAQDLYVDFVSYYAPATYESYLTTRKFGIPNDTWLLWQAEKEDRTCLSALAESSVEYNPD